MCDLLYPLTLCCDLLELKGQENKAQIQCAPARAVHRAETLATESLSEQGPVHPCYQPEAEHSLIPACMDETLC